MVSVNKLEGWYIIINPGLYCILWWEWLKFTIIFNGSAVLELHWLTLHYVEYKCLCAGKHFCMVGNELHVENQDVQESPPAWTQEAHRPPRSKYTLCCSGRGTPSQVGYPSPSRPGKGYPPPSAGWGVPPSQTWEGVPLPLSRCELTHKLKLLPFLILRMRVVKIKLSASTCKFPFIVFKRLSFYNTFLDICRSLTITKSLLERIKNVQYYELIKRCSHLSSHTHFTIHLNALAVPVQFHHPKTIDFEDNRFLCNFTIQKQ